MGRAHHRGCGGAEGPSGDADQRNGARYFRVDQRSLQQIGQRDRTFGHEGKPDACHHHGLHPVFTFGSKPRIEIDFPVAANPHHDLSHFASKAINVILIRQIAEFDGIQTGQLVFWWKDHDVAFGVKVVHREAVAQGLQRIENRKVQIPFFPGG